MERPETVFEWLARRRNVTVEEMRAYISARIAKGWNSPDPARRKHAADTMRRGYSYAGGMAAVCGGEDQGGRARGSAVSAG